jgi:hypothetical protein
MHLEDFPTGPLPETPHTPPPIVPHIAMQSSRRHATGYLPVENYGLIGNMHTCAMVGIDGSIDYMCW